MKHAFSTFACIRRVAKTRPRLSSPVPAALSGGPAVLLQQLLGSADLQLVVRGRLLHPYLDGQAVNRVKPGGHAEGLVGQA